MLCGIAIMQDRYGTQFCYSLETIFVDDELLG